VIIFFGVAIYSFIVGSFSSIAQNQDEEESKRIQVISNF